MIKVLYVEYPLGAYSSQEAFLIDNEGHKYGIASSFEDNYYLVIPANEIEEIMHTEKVTKPIVTFSSQSGPISNLIKAIDESCESKISSDLVNAIKKSK